MWSKFSKWVYATLLGSGLVTGGYFVSTNLPAPAETVWVVNGLTVYSDPGMFGAIRDELRKQGYVVKVWDHTDTKRWTDVPDVMVGHSMGANGVLKAAARLQKEGKQPRLIVTIDPGKKPLYSQCPKPIRCVNLYAPRLFIGGQTVDKAENYHIRGTVHSTMPTYPKVVNAVVRTINEGKK